MSPDPDDEPASEGADEPLLMWLPEDAAPEELDPELEPEDTPSPDPADTRSPEEDPLATPPDDVPLPDELPLPWFGVDEVFPLPEEHAAAPIARKTKSERGRIAQEYHREPSVREFSAPRASGAESVARGARR
jgi:hypothetical protein